MAEPELLLAEAFSDRYRIERELGRGGMATVYLAFDSRHRRQVAIKVLRPDLAASLGSERFLKEIEIAARLTHPHIVPLLDSGQAAAFLYYVMPYIEGASLRRRLVEQRKMPPGQALEIAAPVADALAYAHQMRVFHRDIKPENILFSQGHPIVADFGIAKAISTAGSPNLTRTGFPLGTPGYMSPEQAAGLTDLDARTDVYSLAVVVYEMIVGEIPGRWPTEEAVRAGRFIGAPPRHLAALAQAGPQIESALMRGLAVRHDQRTATPLDLVEDLRAGRDGAPRRRYSESEVGEIVQRAAELEASMPTESGAMTIGGVESLAAEVGIKPERVRAAALSLRSPGAGSPPLESLRRKPWLGGPTRLYFERVVAGELPEAEYPTLVDEIRRRINHPGQVSQLGWSFSWTATRGGGTRRDLEIAVSVREGQTRIVARESLSPLLGAVYGGIGGGMGGGGMGPIMGMVIGALDFPPIALVAVIPAWLATTFMVARTAYSSSSRRRAWELEDLIARLADLTQQLIAQRRALEKVDRRPLLT